MLLPTPDPSPLPPGRISIRLTAHARKRLQMPRQQGITLSDVLQAAASIKPFVPQTTRFRGFHAANRSFDLVIRDPAPGYRLVITVVGYS